MLKLAVPDLVSNSYFPAIAAIELGFFAQEKLDVALELVTPVDKSYHALREGAVDFVGGSAHSVLAAFPEWRGARLLAALGQGMYWFLVMHSDLAPRRGDVSVVKGRRIGAAPMVELGLKCLLADCGIDLVRDRVHIAPVPVPAGGGLSFGVNAAKALAARQIDGFWANGMGAEVAVQSGAGKIVLDVRRGDGPPGAFDYTIPVLVATDDLVARSPETAAAAVRAIVNCQNALKRNVDLATDVGRKLFPAHEAGLIAGLVARDLPFYSPVISAASYGAVNAFSRRMGLLESDPPYADAVATGLVAIWDGAVPVPAP